MIDGFDSVVLSCGHSITSYKGLGVCMKCKEQHCGQCLMLVDDLLLCPKCFKEKMEDSS